MKGIILAADKGTRLYPSNYIRNLQFSSQR